MIRLRRPSEVFVPLSNAASIFLLGMAGLHLFLAIVGFSGEEDFDQFHEHHSYTGMVLLATRIGLWLLFGTALRKLNASVDYNSKMVLVVVGAVGSLYFLSF